MTIKANRRNIMPPAPVLHLRFGMARFRGGTVMSGLPYDRCRTKAQIVVYLTRADA
jgi:hypothetical protein